MLLIMYKAAIKAIK